MQDSHQRFTKEYGGQVFIVFVEEGETKKIANPEVIEEIRQEIARLQSI
jgi:hypothetical protein